MHVSRVEPLLLLPISLFLSACNESREHPQAIAPEVTVAAVQSKAVTLTQRYVGQCRSHLRIDVRAPQAGIVQAFQVKEGQTVKQNDLLFQLKSTAGKERQGVETNDKLVSVTAPFEGMVGRLPAQGAFFKMGETLTTLADNDSMWVYFNIPEARYLEFKSGKQDLYDTDLKIELVLANGEKFNQLGKLGAIGAGFDHETGHIAFRADFPNPDHLLRNGQTGTVLVSRVRKEAVVVPQRAVFPILGKQYVYVVDKEHVAHQREIEVEDELEDLFIVKKGVDTGDNVVLDGGRQIHDGEKVNYDDHSTNEFAAKLK